MGQQGGYECLLMSALHCNAATPPPPSSHPPFLPGMHGDGLWGTVEPTRMQCVCCCLAVRFAGPGAMVGWRHVYIRSLTARQGTHPAGQNTELMVCSIGRTLGMLNLAA